MQARLAALRAAKSGSTTRIDQVQIKDESLYDTLTDEEYLKRMQGNKDVVDFVVQDQDGTRPPTSQPRRPVPFL